MRWKMSVWQIDLDRSFAQVEFVNDQDKDEVITFAYPKNIYPYTKNFSTISSKPIPVVFNAEKEIPDISYLDIFLSNPVFGKHAYQILMPLIAPYVQVKELSVNDSERWMMISVAEALDCVDRQQTKMFYRPDGTLRGIRPFENLTFRNDVISGRVMFRIDIFPAPILVSDDFKALIDEHKLTGLEFLKRS
jgi:hypothetical protein